MPEPSDDLLSSVDSEAPQNQPKVVMGTRMPGRGRNVPVLAGRGQDAGIAQAEGPDDPQHPRSGIAEGLSFTGNVELTGVCTVSGRVEGNIKQAQGAKIAVIVTESGYVKGDIVADQISVMGRTDGSLDAAGGSVSLHDSASVSGHVRYNRLQVNGADLNATLERSPATPRHGG
jgi:cytoskeletal protein CcmA (bactofilin family)